MSERIKVINYLESLFRELIPESFYMRNRRKEVKYPYMTFALSGEPIRFQGQGFYIDMDIFDDNKSSDVDLLKAVSVVTEKFQDGQPFNQLTDDFLVQIEYRSDTGIPTGSDTLQRHTLQLYIKIDWRK